MPRAALGLLGLAAVLLVVGGTVGGGLLARALGAQEGLGSTLGLLAGAALSGTVLRRAYERHWRP